MKVTTEISCKDTYLLVYLKSAPIAYVKITAIF